jgi:MYXO-CTERM domain-containing protein
VCTADHVCIPVGGVGAANPNTSSGCSAGGDATFVIDDAFGGFGALGLLAIGRRRRRAPHAAQ